MQSLPPSPRQLANRPPLLINTQLATLRHSPTRPGRPHVQAPLQERRLGLKGALGPVPGRKGRKGPPRAAVGMGISLSLFVVLLLLAVFGAEREGGSGGEASLDRDHKGAGAAQAQPSAGVTGATGAVEGEEEGPPGPMFVAERIRNEHAQLWLGGHGGARAGPTRMESAAEAAGATHATAPAVATPAAAGEPVDNDVVVEEETAFHESELVMIEVEDHHSLTQLAEAAAMGEVAVKPANAAMPQPKKTSKKEMCERSLTFKLGNRHGLGSEVALLVRAAAVARAYGYDNLFINDDDWNFGKWTDYFEPPSNDCLPPPARKVTTSMQLSRDDLVALPRPPRYTRQAHIAWSTRDLEGLDQTFASLFVDRRELAQLQADDRARLRPARGAQVAFGAPGAGGAGAEPELVPRAFREAFRVQREVLSDVWRPNGITRRMMDELRVQMGLDQTAAGGAHGRVEEVVIAVHCRLGDKHKELGHLLPPSPTRRPNEVPGLHDELLDAFYDNAGRAIDRILAQDGLAPSEADSEGEVEEGWGGRPKLALMSDDVGALETFALHEDAPKWRVEGTEPKGRKVDAWKGRGGFSETFHNKLPLAKRVGLARKFVRDLSLLAQESDGIVLTASSNVGRLMALLAGDDKAVVKGRVKSLDTRWFPLARFL